MDSRHDASLAHFGHAVGHACAACDAIRSIGPSGFTSIMGRILAHNIQRAEGTLTTEEQREAALPPKARKKAAKARHKASLRERQVAFLSAVKAA